MIGWEFELGVTEPDGRTLTGQFHSSFQLQTIQSTNIVGMTLNTLQNHTQPKPSSVHCHPNPNHGAGLMKVRTKRSIAIGLQIES